MRPQKVDDQDMLQGLMSVLRAKGYDGASLMELADAAGLKKASLYHRFPGGKKEMTAAVLDYVSKWTAKHIYDVLVNESHPPKKRLSQALDHIRTLYKDGEAICIIRALSMDTGMALFGEQINTSLQQWITAFALLGKDLGLSPALAKKEAVQTLIEIQGSLVVSKGTGDTDVFDKTLKKIAKRYVS